MSEIIIKKNILLTILPIITLLFILPLLERILLLLYILIAHFSFENLIFCSVVGSGIIAMFLIGLSDLISIILFGMKAFVINDIGITYCKWKVKTIYWEDIEDLKLNSIPNLEHHIPDYELIIYLKNGKEKTISLSNTSIKVSERKIYEWCLKKLHKNR